MNTSKLFKALILNKEKEGKLLLIFLFVLYSLYFVTSLVFVWGVTIDIITERGNFDISEGKAALYILFIGQIIYLLTHLELLEPIIKHKKMDRIVFSSLIITFLVIVIIRELHKYLMV